LPQEKEDAGAVVFEAAEAAGIGLDGLDLGVEALGEGIGDRVLEVRQKIHQMAFEGAGHGHHLRQTAALDGAVPLGEEAFAAGRVRLPPELQHLLLVQPGPGGLQVHFQQLGAAGLMLFLHDAMQPRIPSLLEGLVALFGQLGRLLPAALVDRLVEVLGNMEKVMYDRSLRSGDPGGIRTPFGELLKNPRGHRCNWGLRKNVSTRDGFMRGLSCVVNELTNVPYVGVGPFQCTFPASLPSWTALRSNQDLDLKTHWRA